MLIIYADGACRGNPGQMAIGVSIQRPHGYELETVSEARGHGTNNIAEYQAAIATKYTSRAKATLILPFVHIISHLQVCLCSTVKDQLFCGRGDLVGK